MSDDQVAEPSIETKQGVAWWWLIVALAAGLAIGAIGAQVVVQGQANATIASLNSQLEDSKLKTAAAESAFKNAKEGEDQAAAALVESTKKKIAAAPAPTAQAPQQTTFGDGVYFVGTDMPAGRYKGAVIGGNPYWKISKDANGSDIVQNGLPTGSSFYLAVTKGQYLEIADVTVTLTK